MHAHKRCLVPQLVISQMYQIDVTQKHMLDDYLITFDNTASFFFRFRSTGRLYLLNFSFNLLNFPNVILRDKLF